MTSLPYESLFTLLAEMGIAVVGFSMIAGVLRRESREDHVRLFVFRDVGEIGLICAVVSAFPLLLHAFDVPLDSIWRLTSGVQGAWSAAGIFGAVQRREPEELKVFADRHWLTSTIVFILVLANFGLVAVNLVSPGPYSGARCAACLLFSLAQSGVMFFSAAFDMIELEDRPAR